MSPRKACKLHFFVEHPESIWRGLNHSGSFTNPMLCSSPANKSKRLNCQNIPFPSGLSRTPACTKFRVEEAMQARTAREFRYLFIDQGQRETWKCSTGTWCRTSQQTVEIVPCDREKETVCWYLSKFNRWLDWMSAGQLQPGWMEEAFASTVFNWWAVPGVWSWSRRSSWTKCKSISSSGKTNFQASWRVSPMQRVLHCMSSSVITNVCFIFRLLRALWWRAWHWRRSWFMRTQYSLETDNNSRHMSNGVANVGCAVTSTGFLEIGRCQTQLPIPMAMRYS